MSVRTAGSIPWWRVGFILAAAAALRWIQLGHESLWFDEAYSIQLAARPVSSILSERWIDIHPPLYYLVLHGWMGLVGSSEAAARSLSLLFDTCAILAAYAVARRLAGHSVALTTAILLAVSPFHVEYSQESRMYALLVLLSTLSMGSHLALLTERRRRDQVAYIASTTLMLYTHAYGAFVVAVEVLIVLGLWVWRRELFSRAWRRWLTAAAVIVALYAPWLATLADQLVRVQSAFWIDRPGWDAVLAPFEAYAGSLPLLLLSLALGVIGLWWTRRRSTHATDAPLPAALVLIPWLVVPTVVPFLLSQVSAPIFLPKYTIAASVPFAILVARGVMALSGRAWRGAALLAFAVLLLPVFRTYFGTIHKDGWRAAATRLESDARAGDLAVFYPWYNEVPYDYYRRRDDIVRRSFVPDIHTLIPVEADIPDLVSRLADQPRVWFVVLQGTPGRDAIVAELSRARRLTRQSVAEHVEIFLFEARR